MARPQIKARQRLSKTLFSNMQTPLENFICYLFNVIDFIARDVLLKSV